MTMRRPAVLAAAAAAAGVAGICVSVYLTVVHYSALPLVCSTTGAVDCERVLSSGYAVIAGTAIPTSVAGIAWFAISTVLATFEMAGASPAVVRIHLAWAAVGLATILYLLFVEIVQLGAICIWCSAAHALVLVTFLAILAMSQNADERRLQ
jgi:uncharacterized membrane protein